MALMVKEFMVEAFGYDALRGPSLVKCCNTDPLYKKVSKLTTFSEKIVVQQPDPLARFARDGSFKKDLALDPVSSTITGTVTIKNSMSTEEQIMATMLQSFHTFSNTLRGRGMVMQLVSTEIDSRTMEPKLSKPAVLDWLRHFKVGAERSTHRIEFEIDSNFGLTGAITVTNKYNREIFLEGFSIEGVVDIACNSWVQPEIVHPEKRIFFINKSEYLPYDTPADLKELRKQELRQLRGNGKGLRKGHERIYDFYVYNDLGYPDEGNEYVRPILGTREYSSPRRCRTGRPLAVTGELLDSTHLVRRPLLSALLTYF